MMAVEDAWRRWYPVAREKARRVLGCPGEADDVAQEAFVRFWKAGMVGTEPRRASAWLYRTTTRLSIDRLRARAPHVTLDAIAEEPDPAGPADQLLVLRRELQRIAASVPDTELEVAILHRVDRLGQAEIAEVAGITDRTVRRLLRRLDERLEELRREDGP